MSIAYQLQIKKRPHYITQSLIDLAGICLKHLFEEVNNQTYLQNVINIFLPGYKLDDQFTHNSSDSIISPI